VFISVDTGYNTACVLQDKSMKLNVHIGDYSRQIDVPDAKLAEAEGIFAKMNDDMDKGWQMSRSWVDNLDARQRCQVAADRLLTAIENENDAMAMLMAGYILKTMPGIQGIYISVDGDMNQTEIEMG
jgi:hypothetical protein